MSGVGGVGEVGEVEVNVDCCSSWSGGGPGS